MHDADFLGALMATVYIVKRQARSGPRWSVRCEIRNRPILRLGTFGSAEDAKRRKAAVISLIARYPIDQDAYPALIGLDAPPPAPSITVGQVAREWLATLHDLSESTLKGYRHAVRMIPDWLGGMAPEDVEFNDVQRYATELSERFKRGTISQDIGVLRQVLDYAGVTHNPARGRKIRLPKEPRRVYRLPTREQILEMHRVMPNRSALMTFLEHTGLRIEEAACLRWCDFDRSKNRFLVREGKTTNAKRWVEHLPDTPPFPEKPPEDDDTWRVFRNPSASSLTGMMRTAHLRHGSFLMSAHEWRHYHASRLLHDGTLSPAQIAGRMGHANPAITLSTYSHIVPPD